MSVLATSMAEVVDESGPWVKLSQLNNFQPCNLFLSAPETPLIPSSKGLKNVMQL
ncbi:hypothetical protein K435DRAFT_777546, partial [Dendrothele bispora CBS 962.96]